MDPSAYDSLAQSLHFVVSLFGHALVIFAHFAVPMFVFFVVQRRHQINHPRLELSPTLPAQISFAILFSTVYGIIMPIGYQLLVRSHDRLEFWAFGPNANPPWLIFAQTAVMIWLGARLVQSVLNRDLPRFAGWIDRLMASSGIFLVAWVFGSVFPFFLHELSYRSCFSDLMMFPYYLSLVFPMTCLMGAMLVFALALMEAIRAPSSPPPKKIFVSWALAAGFVAIAFSPFMIVAPRVPAAQALASIEANRDDIESTASTVGVDPRLLAGIIYTAQTRDHSRFTNEFVCRLYAAYREQSSPDYMPNPRLGLCPMTESAAATTLKLIEYHHGLADTVALKVRERERVEHRERFEAKIDLNIAFDAYYGRIPIDFPDALVDELRGCYPIQHEILKFEKRKGEAYRRFVKKQAAVRMEMYELANCAPELLFFKMYLTSRRTTYFDYFSSQQAPRYDLRREEDYNFYYPVLYHSVYYNSIVRRPDNRLNLLVAAAELGMFDQAWRKAGIPITNRPEILATLFNLDEEIIPHALPQPNEFGRQAAAFMRSPECARIFPAPVMVSCARRLGHETE